MLWLNSNMTTCPFCTLPAERIIHTSQHGLIIRDGFPITPGHTLIIPRRHVDSFFNLTADEKLDLLGLLEIAKADVDAEFKPDSYNIGVNDGPAAGQTVPHLKKEPTHSDFLLTKSGVIASTVLMTVFTP